MARSRREALHAAREHGAKIYRGQREDPLLIILSATWLAVSAPQFVGSLGVQPGSFLILYATIAALLAWASLRSRIPVVIVWDRGIESFLVGAPGSTYHRWASIAEFHVIERSSLRGTKPGPWAGYTLNNGAIFRLPALTRSGVDAFALMLERERQQRMGTEPTATT